LSATDATGAMGEKLVMTLRDKKGRVKKVSGNGATRWLRFLVRIYPIRNKFFPLEA
jgi:hypothetical protein